MANDTPVKTLSDKQAARYIGFSTSWLRQSRMTGNPHAPPFLKFGRAVRYLVEDLDAWLERHRRWPNGTACGSRDGGHPDKAAAK